MRYLVLVCLLIVGCKNSGRGNPPWPTQDLTIYDSGSDATREAIKPVLKIAGMRVAAWVEIPKREMSFDDWFAWSQANTGGFPYAGILTRPLFNDGLFWTYGYAAAVCARGDRRVSVSSWDDRNIPASRTALLHELGHLLGAPHDTKGAMTRENNGELWFSRRSVIKILGCFNQG